MLGIVIHNRATAVVAPVRERPRPLAVPPPRPQRPRGRPLWWVAAVLVAVAGLAFHYRARLAVRSRPVPPAAVRTAVVRSGTLEQTIRLVGSTAPHRSVHLRAPYLRGRRSSGGGTDFQLTLERLAATGSQVKKGDPVAGFDRLYMLNRLDDRRAARVDREAQLNLLKAELEVKRAAHEQAIRVARGKMDKATLDLKTASVRSKIQAALLQVAYDEARMSYNALLKDTQHIEASGRAEIRRAQLDLQEAVVEERRAEANVERMVVRAPIDGLAVPAEVYRGSEFGQVRIGDQLRPGQPYLQIVDPSSMIVEARANQVDIEHLRIGAPVRVNFDAYPGIHLPARVYSIGPLAKSPGRRADYVAEVPVVLQLERMDPRVIPNLSVSADVIAQREQSAGIVPRGAIFQDAEDGQPFAFVRTRSGWEKRDLELGLANHVAVAVRSGLRAGEVIAAEKLPEAG